MVLTSKQITQPTASLGHFCPPLLLQPQPAAFKALNWSPHQNSLLASSGGSTGKKIRFWISGNLDPCAKFVLNYVIFFGNQSSLWASGKDIGLSPISEASSLRRRTQWFKPKWSQNPAIHSKLEDAKSELGLSGVTRIMRIPCC
ncbi:hypothetical protein PtB15_5B719 [Puccinia triticina]|nr:hypothetical protein PtB15_5B719 [Puccinia triticina]